MKPHRKPYRPIMIQKAHREEFFLAMAADITKNLSIGGELGRRVACGARVTPQMRFKAANYHDAYDFALKNFALVDDPLFYAEET
jgi:hypothetical protein